MAVERINYQAGNTACTGALVYDERASGPRPLMLMAPNWLGVTDDAIKRAASMAGSKYVAFVADMYGGGKIPAGPPEAMSLANALRADAPERRRRIDAALDTLAQREHETKNRRPQAPGCRGLLFRRRKRSGARAHRRRCAGRHLPARRFVDAHFPAKPGDIKAAICVMHGAKDPVVPKKDRDAFEAEMEAVGAKWQMLVFGGLLHSFCEAESDVPGIACFDPGAARQCYAMIDDFATAAFDGKL